MRIEKSEFTVSIKMIEFSIKMIRNRKVNPYGQYVNHLSKTKVIT